MAPLPKALTRTAVVLLVLGSLLFTSAFVAILWGDPVFKTKPDVSPEALKAAGISFEQPYPAAQRGCEYRPRAAWRDPT